MERLEARLRSEPAWRWFLVSFILCASVPVLCSWPEFPDAGGFTQGWVSHWDAVVELKIKEPFRNPSYDFAPSSNEAKRGFRLIVPLFAHVTNSGLTGVHAFRFAMQGLLIACVIIAATQVCRERLSALALALTVMGTYVGTSVWRDTCRWFDNCAHAFLALALTLRAPWAVFAALLVASFTDERTFLVIPIIYLYHHLLDSGRGTRIAILLSVPASLVLRFALGRIYGLHTPIAGVGDLQIIAMNLEHLPTGVWFALEGGWILLAVATVAAVKAGYRGGAFCLILATALPALTPVAVIDFSRSASYAFPAAFAAAALLRRVHPGEGSARVRLALLAAGVSLVTPNVFVMGSAFPEVSAPIRILMEWLRATA